MKLRGFRLAFKVQWRLIKAKNKIREEFLALQSFTASSWRYLNRWTRTRDDGDATLIMSVFSVSQSQETLVLPLKLSHCRVAHRIIVKAAR